MAKLPDLEAEALKLDPGARARLAERLLTSLEGLSESEIEGLWLAEAERRDTELESEVAAAVPASRVLADLRSRLK